MNNAEAAPSQVTVRVTVQIAGQLDDACPPCHWPFIRVAAAPESTGQRIDTTTGDA